MIRILGELGSRGDLRRWLTLVVVCFGQLMIVLDVTIVNVALPSMRRDLGLDQADLTWVVNGYAISYGGFVLLAGRLGDLLGRKRIFVTGVAVFTVASVACGLAQTPVLLVAARAAQGLGGALTAGVVMAIIVTGFQDPRERAQAMSVFAFTLAGGGSLGLLAGGFLTQAASWHWVFFVNVPIGVATLIAGSALIEERGGAGLGHGIDFAGSILVTAAVTLGVYAIVTAATTGWLSAHTLGLGTASLLLLGAFLVLEARLANPIMPLRVLAIRSLVGASAARALLAVSMFTTFFLGALYLQQVRGYSPFLTGLAFLPFTLTHGTLSAGVTVRLVGRIGSRLTLVIGLLFVAAALLLLSRVGPATPYFPLLLTAYGLFGLGVGLALMPLTLISMADVPLSDAGLASGVGNVSMQVAAALGLAVLGTVAAERTRSLVAARALPGSALTGGYELAFTLAAALAVCALLVVLVVLRGAGASRPAPRREAAEDDEGLEAA